MPKSRLLARITSFARGDWEELLIVGRDCFEAAAQFRSRRRRTHAPTIDQRADRVEHMVCMGELFTGRMVVDGDPLHLGMMPLCKR